MTRTLAEIELDLAGDPGNEQLLAEHETAKAEALAALSRTESKPPAVSPGQILYNRSQAARRRS